MESRVSYVLVGLFVVLLGTGMIIAGLWLADGLDRQTYRLYSVYTTESVAGITPDAAVTYRGVGVGRVARIEIDRDDPQRIHLLLQVRETAPVRQGTTATFSRRGLTGITYVELSGAKADAPPLSAPPGEPHPVIPFQETLLMRLDTVVTEGLKTMDTLSDSLNALLSEENRTALSETLANLRRVSAALAENDERITRTMTDLERLLENGGTVAESLPDTLQRLDAAIGRIDRMATTVQQAGTEFSALSEQGRQGLDRVMGTTLPEVDTLLGELRLLTSRLSQLSRTLEQDPSLLLFGRPPQEPGPGENPESP